MANKLVEILVTIKDEASAAFERLKGSVGGVVNAMTSLKGIVLEFVASKAIEFIGGMVEAFAEEEQTVTRLNVALRVAGQYSEQGSAAIQEMAEKMLETTTHSKEEALGISASFASLARELTTDQLAQAQKLAIGLADATGKSTEAASLMIVRSLTGQGNALKRWGVDLDTSGTQQEKFNTIMAKLGPLFAISQGEANTLAGHIAQTKNQFHELEVTVGETIARFLGINERTSTLRDKLIALRGEIVQHGEEWIRYGHAVIASFGVIGAAINAGIQIIVSLISGLATTLFGGVLLAFSGVATALDAVWEAVSVAVKYGINKAIIEPLNTLFEGVDFLAKKIGKSFEFRLGEIDTTDPFKRTREQAAITGQVFNTITGEWKDQFALVKNAIGEVGDAMGVVTGILNTPTAPLPGVKGSGAGANIGVAADSNPSEDLRRQLEEQKLLEAEYKAGVKTFDEYQAGLTKIHDQLTILRSASGLSRAELVQLYEALGKIKDVKITELLAQQERLTAAFKSGKLTTAEYDAAIKTLVLQMEKLLRAAGLTEAQIQKITKAMRDAGTSMKGIGPQMAQAFGLGPGQGGEALATANQEIAKMAFGLGTAFTDAVGQALAAGGTFGEVIKKAVGTAAASFAKMSVGRALMEVAEGIAASLVPGKQAEAAGHFAAAKVFGAAAVFMGGFGAATGGFAGGGSSSAANGSVSASAGSVGKGKAIIQIQGGLLDMSNPDQAESLRKAIADLTDRDVVLED